MQITKLKYLIIYLIILILPLSFVAICSYFIPSLNEVALKTYYTYYGGMSLGVTSLIVLILTNLFVKQNFKNNNEIVDNNYILKINLIYIIFHLIISIISNILNYFQIPNYFIYSLYVFYPLIYFCLVLFMDHKQLNVKSVFITLLSVYLFWYFLVPLLSYLITTGKAITNIIMLKSLLYSLFYSYLKFSLLVMPFMSLGLLKLSNEKNKKSIVHKFEFSIPKLFICAIILVIISILIALLLNR